MYIYIYIHVCVSACMYVLKCICVYVSVCAYISAMLQKCPLQQLYWTMCCDDDGHALHFYSAPVSSPWAPLD